MIARNRANRYHRHTCDEGGRMDEAELRRRLDLGADDEQAWLLTAEAGVVTHTSKSHIHRLAVAGRIRWRRKFGSAYRVFHPDDLLAMIADSEQIHGGEAKAAAPEEPPAVVAPDEQVPVVEPTDVDAEPSA